MALRIVPNKEENAISDMVARFFRDRSPLSAQLEASRTDVALPRDLLTELAGLEIFHEALADDAEPSGPAPLVCCLIAEAGGRELVPGPWVDQLIAVRVCGSDTELVAPLLAGEQIAAFAVAPELSVESGTISGVVRGLRFGDKVDRWILMTEHGAQVVDPGAPGVTEIHRERTIDPLWQSVTAFLDGAPVVARIELTADEREAVLGYGRSLASAVSVGAGARVLEDGIAYVNSREQFGRPLGSFQAIKHRASNGFIALLHARSMTRRSFVTGSPHDAHVARVASDHTYRFVSEQVVQMYGGVGFTAAVPVHLFLKNAQQLRGWPTHVEDDLQDLRDHLALDPEEAIA